MSFPKALLFAVLFQFTNLSLFAQLSSDQSAYGLQVVFYNVENYFDMKEDTVTNYNEFTPQGNRFWSQTRFTAKRNRLYKVITAIGGWQLPDVVAFAEIENRYVLEDLLANTPLWNQNYKIIHFESGDHRGIDIGLIYNPEKVEKLHSMPFHLYDDEGKSLETRDILYVKFKVKSDTLHFLVNHWPSRYGGMMISAPKREIAARRLKWISDSICNASDEAKILIMGDFNDESADKSMQILINPSRRCQLRNVGLENKNPLVKGTLKYQGNWNNFDQVIASISLLSNQNGLTIEGGKGFIFDQQFLLEDDKKYLGLKPNRTYVGFKYHGGFSDHLPIFVNLRLMEKE